MLSFVIVPAMLSGLLKAPSGDVLALKTRIVSASVFKPGLVLITREVMVPTGRHKCRLETLPAALDGSFWYGSPDKAEVGELVTKLRFTQERVKVKAIGILELLSANVGKQMTFWITEYAGLASRTRTKITATLEQFVVKDGYNVSTAYFRMPNGTLRTLSPGGIDEIDDRNLVKSVEKVRKRMLQSIDFEAYAEKPSRVQFMSFESGAAWTCSYLLHLGSNDQANIEAKVQLGLGGLSFDSTDVKAMAGLPTLSFDGKLDLAAGIGTIDGYVSGGQYMYGQTNGGRGVDPYTQVNQFLQEAQNQNRDLQLEPATYSGGGIGGGGFSSRGYEGNVSTQNGLSKPIFELRNPEDLFAYSLGRMTLEPGDRVTRKIFDEVAKYEPQYSWHGDEHGSIGQVKKTLKLENKGKFPWTGGHCLIMKGDMPIAQLEMPFTAVDQKAILTLSSVEDLEANREMREVTRRQINERFTSYWLADVETKITLLNARKEPATIEVSYSLEGKLTDPAGGTVSSVTQHLADWNPTETVSWRIVLQPGERKELTILYTKRV